jgi:hypothetical protein
MLMSKIKLDRVVELQRQVKIARTALEKIERGSGNHFEVAATALEKMWPSDRKQPLQVLVGHEKRRET